MKLLRAQEVGMPSNPETAAEQPICITCGKVGGTCRWTDDAERCMRVQLDKMRAALKGYEQWEADLIFDHGAWRGIDGLPHITQSLWDRLLELQAMRNTAIGGVTNGT